MKKYKNFFDFLIKTPRNLMSVVIIDTMAIVALFFFRSDMQDTEIHWIWFVHIFLSIIFIMAWARVWSLWKRNKDTRI